MSLSKCECSMAIRMVGTGCRYCQPQEHIDLLLETITDLESELEAAKKEIERLTIREVNDEQDH